MAAASGLGFNRNFFVEELFFENTGGPQQQKNKSKQANRENMQKQQKLQNPIKPGNIGKRAPSLEIARTQINHKTNKSTKPAEIRRHRKKRKKP